MVFFFFLLLFFFVWQFNIFCNKINKIEMVTTKYSLSGGRCEVAVDDGANLILA